MMAQSLILGGFDHSRISLKFVRGNDDERLVVVIDNNLVLNYSFAEVFVWDDIQEDLQILANYKYSGEKFIPA